MFVVQIIFSAHKVHQISKISNDLEVVWESIFHVFVCTYKFFFKNIYIFVYFDMYTLGPCDRAICGGKGDWKQF